MNSETFCAYQFPRNNDHGPGQLVAAVSFDLAQDIDERNGWLEPAEQPSKLAEAHVACQQSAAAGLNELILFCFRGQPLHSRSVKLVIQKLVAIAFHVNNSELRAPLRVPVHNGFVERAGPPISLAALARCVDSTPHKLRKHWRDYRQRWSFTARIAKRPRKRLTRSK
jgi:hypothetical protein